MNRTDPTLPTIDQAQREIVEEFAMFGDWTERYQYLIDLGRKLPALDDALKSDANLVSGCQSQVWFVPRGDAAQLRFDAISDSSIVSGLIALLLRVYSGRSARQILDTEPRFVEEIGLSAHLSPTRSGGLAAMIVRIKAVAAQRLSDG